MSSICMVFFSVLFCELQVNAANTNDITATTNASQSHVSEPFHCAKERTPTAKAPSGIDTYTVIITATAASMTNTTHQGIGIRLRKFNFLITDIFDKTEKCIY